MRRRGWHGGAERPADAYRFLTHQGGLAALLLREGHVLVPSSAGGRSDTERGVRELSDGEDCERFEHLGLLSSRKLPWKEKAANPPREGSGVASLLQPAEGWHCLHRAPHCALAAFSPEASLGLENYQSCRIVVPQE